ncbi:MAG TPA: DUF1385 domain-containing protein [Terriglobales bacterium]|nr:DUF1385 domain-containing protein [Terriglobales bacterium]
MKPLATFRARARHCLRQALHLQLLIALEGGEAEILVGGQAVMEGVMMRAPHSYAVAVRRPDGTLATTTRPLTRPSDRHRLWGWPLLRGLATLGQAMALGVRALRFSSDQILDDAPAAAPAPAPAKEVTSWALIASLAFSLLFFIAFYKLVPLLAATGLARLWPAFSGQIAFNLVDGLVRILLFLAFIGGLSLLPDIRRVYQYHGAEHKVVFNFESGQPVDVAHARAFTTLHPRCGTSFMIVIMLLAMAFYLLIPVQTFWMRLLVRIALLPVIAGLAYEIIRFSAQRSRSVFALLARPGLWLQRITTQEPTDAQLECSIRSLQEAMALEQSQGGDLVIS